MRPHSFLYKYIRIYKNYILWGKMAFSRYFDNSQLAEAIRIANDQTKGVSHINKFGFGG
jgi:hypothetical protein